LVTTSRSSRARTWSVSYGAGRWNVRSSARSGAYPTSRTSRSTDGRSSRSAPGHLVQRRQPQRGTLVLERGINEPPAEPTELEVRDVDLDAPDR
jgi:hypothetical protein